MKRIPKHKWPSDIDATRKSVWRDKKYLVQVFKDNGVIRISINRVKVNDDGGWVDNITWDELQDIKRQVGYGDRLAVEVYPKDMDIENVANMRHLWILDAPIHGVGWAKSGLC